MATGLQLNIFQRLKLIKISVCIGLLISVLCSYNLWAGQRWFPVAPVFEVLPVLPVVPVFDVEPVLPVEPVFDVEPVLPVEPVSPVEPVLPVEPEVR